MKKVMIVSYTNNYSAVRMGIQKHLLEIETGKKTFTETQDNQ